jgi:hypothetical protein
MERFDTQTDGVAHQHGDDDDLMQVKRQKIAAAGLLAPSFEGGMSDRIIVAFETPGDPKPGDIRNGLDVEHQGGGH